MAKQQGKSLRAMRQKFEELDSAKRALAGLSLTKQSEEADKLRNKINSITESLVKMGIESHRINGIYENFVKANAAINNTATSIHGDLLKSVKELVDASKDATSGVSFAFTRQMSDFKAGANNVIKMLQDSHRSAAVLETQSTEIRRKNTRKFTSDAISLTDELISAYDNLIKNEKNIGSAKFKNLNVEEQIANTLVYISKLDENRMQMAGGYYGKLRAQASEILKMYTDINNINKLQKENNDIANQTLISERERVAQAEAWNEEHAKSLVSYDKELEIRNKINRSRTQKELEEAFAPIPTDKELAAQAKLAQEEADAYIAQQNAQKVVLSGVPLGKNNSSQNSIKMLQAIDSISSYRKAAVESTLAAQTPEGREDIERKLARGGKFIINGMDEALEEYTIGRLGIYTDLINQGINYQNVIRRTLGITDESTGNITQEALDAFNKRQDTLDEAMVKRTERNKRSMYTNAIREQLEERERTEKQNAMELKAEEDKQKELQRQSAKAAKEQEKNNKDTMKKFDDMMKSMISKMPLGSVLVQLAKLGPFMQAIAFIIGIVLGLVVKWDTAVSNLAKNLSISRSQAEGVLRASGPLAANLNFANIGALQITEAITKMQEALGGVDISSTFLSGNVFTQRLIAGSAVLTDTFGLAGQELAGMTDAATAMGTSLSTNTAIVTTMSKGIFSVNSLMKSIAALSPKILTGFKGSNSELVGMVSKMKLLGVEANSLISSNDKLLDIESAITNAFEAQVATGVNIDIDRLMYNQMVGNYGDVFEQQLKTLEGADYLNQGALFQQMIAEGVGLDKETASQMMLRKVLVDKLGLTDEILRARQKEGKMIEDEILQAEKLGRITQKEADLLREQTKEYDSKTIQEKLVRSMDNLALSISSNLAPLTDGLRNMATAIMTLANSLASSLLNMPPWVKTAASVVGGIALVGGAAMAGRGIFRFGKNVASVLRMGKGASPAAAVTAATPPAGAGLVNTAGTPISSSTIGSSTGGLRGFASNFKTGLKAAKYGGLVGGAITTGVNLAEGRGVGESISRGIISGGLGLLLGAGGAALGGPLLGYAGMVAGGMIGDYVGDMIFGEGAPTSAGVSSGNASYMQSTLEGTAQGMQQMSLANQAAAGDLSGLLMAIKEMSAKLDTANGILNSINAKSTDVTVELDGEKVGKAAVGYTSAAIDRGRNIGNNYGYNRDQFVTRLPSRSNSGTGYN